MSQHELSDFEIKQALSGIRLDSARRDAIWETVKAQRPARAARGNRRHMEKVIVGYCAAATAFVLTITVGVGMFNGLFGNTPAGTETKYRPGEEIPGDTKTIWADQEIAKERLDKILIDGLATYYRIHNDALDGQDDYEVYLTVPDAGKEILLNVYSNRTGECEPIYREASMADYENGYEQVFSDPRILYDAVLADLNRDGVEELFLSVGCHETRKAELDGNFTESEADGYDLYVANGTEVHRIHKIASDLPVLLGNESDGKLPVYSGEQVSSDFDRIKEQGGYRAVYRTASHLADLGFDRAKEQYVFVSNTESGSIFWTDQEIAEERLDEFRLDMPTTYYRTHSDVLDGQDDYEVYLAIPSESNQFCLNIYSNRTGKSVCIQMFKRPGSYSEATEIIDAVIADLNMDGVEELILTTTYPNVEENWDEFVGNIFIYNGDWLEQMLMPDFEFLLFTPKEPNLRTLTVYSAILQTFDQDSESGKLTWAYDRPNIESGIFGYDDEYTEIGDYKYCYTGGANDDISIIYADKEGVEQVEEHNTTEGTVCYRIHNDNLDGDFESEYEVYTISNVKGEGIHGELAIFYTPTGDWVRIPLADRVIRDFTVADMILADLDCDGTRELLLSVRTREVDEPGYFTSSGLQTIFIVKGNQLVDTVESDHIILFSRRKVETENVMVLQSGESIFSNLKQAEKLDGFIQIFHSTELTQYLCYKASTNSYILSRLPIEPDMPPETTKPDMDTQTPPETTKPLEPTVPPISADQTVYTDNGLILELDSSRTHYIVIGYNGDVLPSDLEIPGSYNGVKVRETQPIFENCSKLTRVTVSTETVDNGTFKNCENLTEVVLTESALRVGDAFAGCKNLKKVVFEATDLEYVHEFAFEGCENLTDIYFAGEESVWKYAAYGLVLPEGATVHFGSVG